MTNNSGKYIEPDTSMDQPKERTTDMDRNASKREKKLTPVGMDEKSFDIVVDKVPYLVKVSPFTFNEEVRFYISINGSGRHVFTWDSEVGELRAIDDEASVIPVALEEEISKRLT